MINVLQYPFIQNALIAGSFIAICCAFLGIFLVLRRFSMIGDGLAHVSFATIALGIFLNVYPIYISIPLVSIASLGILKMTEKSGIYGDAAIGILSSLGIAGGVMLASLAGGFNVDLFSYLFGNILTIGRFEVGLTAALSLCVISLVAVNYHDLFTVTFDEEYARVCGISASRVNQVLILLTAFTVVLGIKVVGTMLVSSLIIFPAVTALQVASSFRTVIAVAVVSAISSVVSGIFISFICDLPAGATIVLVNFAIFIMVFTGRWFYKH